MICQEVGIHKVLHNFPLIYCLPVLVCCDMWVQTGYFDIRNLGVDNLKTKVECKLILGKCKVKRCVKSCWEQWLGIWSGLYSLFVADAWWSLILGHQEPSHRPGGPGLKSKLRPCPTSRQSGELPTHPTALSTFANSLPELPPVPGTPGIRGQPEKPILAGNTSLRKNYTISACVLSHLPWLHGPEHLSWMGPTSWSSCFGAKLLRCLFSIFSMLISLPSSLEYYDYGKWSWAALMGDDLHTLL